MKVGRTKFLSRLVVVVGSVLGVAGCAGEATGPDPAAGPATRAVYATLYAPPAMPAPSRGFTIDYRATIPAAPTGFEVWVPVPSSDGQQAIGQVDVESPLPHELVVEPQYGNRVLHLTTDGKAPAPVSLRYHCVRREEAAPAPAAQPVSATAYDADLSRFLRPDRLGVIDDRIRSIAGKIMADRSVPLDRARAIYDYVIDHMAYDKTVPGWGNGDTARACAVGKGNCTDFHALFISIARACRIPARFGIGFQIPPGTGGGKVVGYHCWAEFWIDGRGWIPVDASEAWKDSLRRDFYFGNLDDNRIRLTVGRDLLLTGMKGPPVNYLLKPYAEREGKAIPVDFAATYTTDGGR